MLKKMIFPLMVLLTMVLPLSFNMKEADAASYYSFSTTPVNLVDEDGLLIIDGQVNYSGFFPKGLIQVDVHLYDNDVFGGAISYYDKIIASNLTISSSTPLVIYDTIPDQYGHAKKGLKCEIILRSTGYSGILATTTIYYYAKDGKVINPLAIEGNSYSFNNIYNFDGSSSVETFYFYNYKNKITSSYYLSLDISGPYFIYSSNGNNSTSYKDATISFYDKNNLFKNIQDSNGVVRIPAKLVNNANRYSVQFKSYYVNKETLEMSFTEKDGFVPTKQFYLPKNKKLEIQGYTFSIEVTGLGINGCTIKYDCSFDASGLMFGPCTESAYCVIGGMVE